MSDKEILARIGELVDQEQQLYREEDLDEAKLERLEAIKIELDRCWDLMRRRRARRVHGQDPDQEEPRSAETVQNYKG